MDTWKVLRVSPAANLRVPDVLRKSLPATARALRAAYRTETAAAVLPARSTVTRTWPGASFAEYR